MFHLKKISSLSQSSIYGVLQGNKKLEKHVEWQKSLKSWRRLRVDHKPGWSCGEGWGGKPNKEHSKHDG